MINVRDLILLEKEEAEIVLKMALRSEIDVYIIDTRKNIPFLLKIGDLENIRRAIPDRTEVILEPAPRGSCIPTFDKVGYLDLRIHTAKYEEIFKVDKEEQINLDNIDLSRNEYYLKLTTMAKRAIYAYSEWKKHNSKRKIMVSKDIEPLLQKITDVTREIEFLKKILTDHFKELQ